MTSTSEQAVDLQKAPERIVSYRKICEFLWNALELDPDDIFEVFMYPDKVVVGRYARNERGGLVIRLPEKKVVTEEIEFRVAHDGD